MMRRLCVGVVVFVYCCACSVVDVVLCLRCLCICDNFVFERELGLCRS